MIHDQIPDCTENKEDFHIVNAIIHRFNFKFPYKWCVRVCVWLDEKKSKTLILQNWWIHFVWPEINSRPLFCEEKHTKAKRPLNTCQLNYNFGTKMIIYCFERRNVVNSERAQAVHKMKTRKSINLWVVCCAISSSCEHLNIFMKILNANKTTFFMHVLFFFFSSVFFF